MDQLIDRNTFKLLNTNEFSGKVRQSIRLLYIFGIDGSKVIYVTTDDEVYGYGYNGNGLLGLGLTAVYIGKPVLNRWLTNQQLVNIYHGFDHVMGLTENGRCYGWGSNRYGQLGIGHENVRPVSVPTLVKALDNQKVVQLSCGGFHTLALTADALVFAFGWNCLGQLGDGTYHSLSYPRLISIQRVVSISCGFCHSMALTDRGMAFVWGFNEHGQLGRPRERDIRPNRIRAVCNRPQLIHGLSDVEFKKAICGRNHSLLLSSDGTVYAFGHNDCGQVGTGSTDDQFSPVKVRPDLKFKDIITEIENDLSIGLTSDDKLYVWGYSRRHIVMIPEEITESYLSLIDIYGKLAKNRVTFEPLVVHGLDSKKKCSVSKEMDVNVIQFTGNPSNYLPLSEVNLNSKAVLKLLSHLRQSFNNPMDCDFELKFKDNSIYCHKTVLQIRNNKFWNVCEKRLKSETVSLITIESDSYQRFFAFIQYLYGIELIFGPQIDVEFYQQLIKMAINYEEPVLTDICTKSMAKHLNPSNFGPIYEISVNYNFADLEKNCIEFVAKNWETFGKSVDFWQMSDSFCHRIMSSFKLN